jgi:hypothetical protein
MEDVQQAPRTFIGVDFDFFWGAENPFASFKREFLHS